ncbi:hypothetical protein [Streptomyces sp. WM6378]|uniref:hypothetical protein n=1 Tax=Streptomyces sp. WM6378 TaxID=1415557 RepID=UPI0006AEE8A3|nr:hypothetical protein [Streptomyces sp. WM6378]KOU36226.1 hypothetical protein ADK54_34910 [Streptomyces sp. WM6378]
MLLLTLNQAESFLETGEAEVAMRFPDEPDQYLYRAVLAERMLQRLVTSVRDVMNSSPKDCVGQSQP